MISEDKIYQYCELHSCPESDILKAIAKTTHLQTLAPRMLSGHLQGNILTLLCKLTHAQYVLEVGTFTGYSAVCLADGLSDNGKVITIEYNPENALIAQQFLDLPPYDKKVEMHIGDAKKIIPILPDNIDLVYIDADKESYPIYYDLVISKCKSGALIIVDNILWSGKVLENSKDKKTQIIHDFNLKVNADPRVEVVILPIRDGLSMIRKK